MSNNLSRPFSSRWLFLLVLLCSGGLLFGIYYTFVLDPYLQDYRRVRRLEARGVRMEYFNDFSPRSPWQYGAMWLLGVDAVNYPHSMHFEGVKIQDEDLRDVGQGLRVWSLYLEGQPITNAGLAHLSRLRLLRLDLSGTQVGSGNCRQPQAAPGRLKPGFESIANNTRLSELRLTDTNVNDVDLAALAKSFSPNFLHLGGTCITDVGLNEAAFFAGVRWLFLNDTQVTSFGLKKLNAGNLQTLDVAGIKLGAEGAAFIGTCLKLETLVLANTEFSSKDCEALKNLTNLHHLSLRFNPITDQALDIVGTLSALQLLRLDGTQITAAGLAKLSELKSLQIISLDDRVLAVPECVTHLRKLGSLRRVVYSKWSHGEKDLERVRKELGPNMDVVELPNQEKSQNQSSK